MLRPPSGHCAGDWDCKFAKALSASEVISMVAALRDRQAVASARRLRIHFSKIWDAVSLLHFGHPIVDGHPVSQNARGDATASIQRHNSSLVWRIL
jgi:hypothetical protein